MCWCRRIKCAPPPVARREIAEYSPLGLISTRATLTPATSPTVFSPPPTTSSPRQTRLRHTDDFKEGVKAMAERKGAKLRQP